MKLKVSFLLYVIVTIFLGTSVQQFLHIDMETEGVIARSHYIALPFLLITYIANYKKIRLSKIDKYLLLLAFASGIANIVLFHKSAGVANFLNTIIEPILLLRLLFISDEKMVKTMYKLVIIFFIVECCVAIFESVTKVILFANISAIEVMGKDMDMRAYSLHGHPLQNAFLVSTISTVILCSRMKIAERYALFFLGYLAVFAFNTRSSVYLLSGVLAVNIYKDLLKGRLNLMQKSIMLIGIFAVIYFGYDYVQTHSLGSRLSVAMTKEDGSSNARFILIEILESMNMKDLLFGISNLSVEKILNQNELVAIENSVVNLIFGSGLLYTVFYFILMFKEIKSIHSEKFMFVVTCLSVFLLLNTNNVILTLCPHISVLVLSLYIFSVKQLFKTNYVY